MGKRGIYRAYTVTQSKVKYTQSRWWRRLLQGMYRDIEKSEAYTKYVVVNWGATGYAN